MYIIFTTNFNHEHSSREIIGTAKSKSTAIKLCEMQAKMDSCKLSKDDFYNLAHIHQTQSFGGDYEFLIEQIKIDTLI